MRIFVGIDVGGVLREAVGRLQKDLDGKIKLKAGRLKWVLPEQMHFTVKFLGEVDEGRVGDICDSVRSGVAGVRKFSFGLSGVGCYGNPVKVIWAEVGKVPGELLDLRERIEFALEDAGFERDKRAFEAHLTLGRIKGGRRDRRLKDAIVNYGPIELPSVAVGSVCVYRSELTSEAAVYSLLCEAELSG